MGWTASTGKIVSSSSVPQHLSMERGILLLISRGILFFFPSIKSVQVLLSTQ